MKFLTKSQHPPSSAVNTDSQVQPISGACRDVYADCISGKDTFITSSVAPSPNTVTSGGSGS